MTKFHIYELISESSDRPAMIYVPDEMNASIEDITAYANKHFAAPEGESFFFPENGNVQELELPMENVVELLHTKNHYKP